MNNFLGVPYDLLGVGLSVNGILVVVGQTPMTEWAIGKRHSTIAIIGIALYAVKYLALGIAAALAFSTLAVFFASVVVITVGENLLSIPSQTLPSNLAPEGELGSYNGAFQLAGGAGFMLSVLMGGFALGALANPLAIWIVLLLPAVPSAILFRHAAGKLSRKVDTA